MRWIIFLSLHFVAMVMPFSLDSSTPAATAGARFPGWPTQFEGRELAQLELSEREQRFSAGFPGEIGRFTDGSREVIVRWVKHASRKLHPSGDCLKGLGYRVSPQPLSRDLDGQLWSCLIAERDGRSLRVCDRIFDQSGMSWSDTSAWFWSAVMQDTTGPWWAYTVAEPI